MRFTLALLAILMLSVVLLVTRSAPGVRRGALLAGGLDRDVPDGVALVERDQVDAPDAAAGDGCRPP